MGVQKMSNKPYIPAAVFDKYEDVIDQYKEIYADGNPHQVIAQWLKFCFTHRNVTMPSFAVKDYQLALNFLYSYRGSTDTFGAYRRDLERLFQWSWFVRQQSILKHKREDIEAFVEFCLKPPKRWMSLKKEPRFKKIHGEKAPNPEWRLFEAHVSKKDHKAGIGLPRDTYNG